MEVGRLVKSSITCDQYEGAVILSHAVLYQYSDTLVDDLFHFNPFLITNDKKHYFYNKEKIQFNLVIQI